VEIEYLMKALENGADGVLVAGCEEGSCHFVQGNFTARRRVDQVGRILEEAGFTPERVRMVNVGAADAGGFVRAVDDMVETVLRLGPSPLGRRRVPALEEIRS
jgi:coenzyme F420-reducing hydrogenase delta subunit